MQMYNANIKFVKCGATPPSHWLLLVKRLRIDDLQTNDQSSIPTYSIFLYWFSGQSLYGILDLKTNYRRRTENISISNRCLAVGVERSSVSRYWYFISPVWMNSIGLGISICDYNYRMLVCVNIQNGKPTKKTWNNNQVRSLIYRSERASVWSINAWCHAEAE